MKRTILLLLLAFTFGCDKDDDNNPSTNPADQLPPATQVGANTFGCLLDGEVFVPGNFQNATNCFYQFVDGEYYFAIQANNYIENNLVGIELGTNRKQIEENSTYNLVENSPGQAIGGYLVDLSFNYTTHTHTGELTITKLTDQIVSGTFWFDVQDSDGVVHQIREGRFDFQYTN